MPETSTPIAMLTAKAVATWLATSEAALAQLRYRNEGPAYVQLGRAIRYRQEDVEAFISGAVVHPAS